MKLPDKINIIIREELKQLITENKNSELYDLNAEFVKWNKKLFDNKLILNFPLRWVNSKQHIAFVDGLKRRDKFRNITYEVTGLNMTDKFVLNQEQFSSIFIHELIHVYLMQTNVTDYGGQHGLYFMKELHRINGMGYNIPVSEDAMSLKLANVENIKPTNFILLQKFNGDDAQYSFGLFKKDATDEELSDKRGGIMSSYIMFYGKTTNDIVSKIPVANSLNTIKYYKLPPELNEIFKSEIIKKIVKS